MPAVGITEGPPPCACDHQAVVRVVVSVSTSQSRDVSRDVPTSRLRLVSRKIVNVSVSAIYVSYLRQFPDGHADCAVRSVNGL